MNEHLDQQIDQAWNAPFQGWDFSYLERYGGNPSTPLPWSYRVYVENALRDANSVLDMGTGGGEFLSTLELPEYTAATEAWPPNIEVATKRLQPLGVDVRGVPLEGTIQDHYTLPFNDATFDIIINRHESYEPAEVLRTLKPGGTFITQQVGECMGENLQLMFGILNTDEISYSWNAANAVQKLLHAGFSIEMQKEDIGTSRFYDIRAIVYYLKAIPWEYPDFTPDSHRQQLYAMQAYLKRHGYFDMTTHHFMLVAIKT